MGFVAIWCQFAQTTFYYPALLAYVASTLAYVFAPSLAHSGLYTTAVIIVLFWSACSSPPEECSSPAGSPRTGSSLER